jgi:threonylcarbamoyladenosine tRNA methylthiotransferase MtaB
MGFGKMSRAEIGQPLARVARFSGGFAAPGFPGREKLSVWLGGFGYSKRNMKPQAAIYTLGCRLNQTESALIAADLERHGFDVVSWGAPADLLVVNSCSVTGTAAQKTRQLVRGARRQFPQAFLVLAGCGASSESERDQWLASGLVDLVVPNAGKDSLARQLPAGLVRPETTLLGGIPVAASSFRIDGVGRHTDRTRASLKIQEGCDFFCSYCIVPTLRGPPRSRAWDDAVRELEALLAAGYKEIVLTGVNVATYADGGLDLFGLVSRLLEVPGDWRLRLSSTEPGPAVARLGELMCRDPRLCRSLHLSAQYGEDEILRLMNRRYRFADYAKLVRELAATVPGLCLGTDIIVGFPGETEARFAACLQALEALPVGYMHVFTFSPRPGTKAAELPGRVPERIAGERFDRLAVLAEKKALEFARSQIGNSLRILTEAPDENGRIQGWSDNYLRVVVASPSPVANNEWLQATITGVEDGRTVVGTIVEEGVSRRPDGVSM